MGIGLEFYLPMKDKHGGHKIYCPNQGTFEGEGSAINDAPDKRQKPEYLKQTGTVMSNPGLTVTL